MAKRKLTLEILESIELCAADQYTLDEIREEANIVRPLMDNPQVQEAINKGRTKWLVEIIAADGDIDPFMYCTSMTLEDLDVMIKKNEEAIELRKLEIKLQIQEIKDRKISNAKKRFSPSNVASSNMHLQDTGEIQRDIDQATLKEELELAVKRMQDGDTTLMLEILTSNVMQLHYFNGQITGNLAGDLGKQLHSFEKLSNMQLKVMQETRKSIMAINEITNPKRTTFIKEANQHNHLHQNSEKKDENKNELQNPEQLQEPENLTDAEVYSIKGKSK